MVTLINRRNTVRWRARAGQLMAGLNGPWHKRAMLIFMVIVMSHWAEHLFQAIQIWMLGWPRTQALGVLGLVFPWLVSSETLHYAYALVMLIGLVVFRPAMRGQARTWWNIALVIQIWHHFEHTLLLSQAIAGSNLFGATAPTSILQLFFPRAELHLFYNALVTMPMIVAMYHHLHPTVRERKLVVCTCAGPDAQYWRVPTAA